MHPDLGIVTPRQFNRPVARFPIRGVLSHTHATAPQRRPDSVHGMGIPVIPATRATVH